MKVAAIIQARMGSSRLPGKVLRDLAGEPMLARVVKRVRRAELLNDVVIATTDDPQDSAITEFCVKHNWPCFVGSQHDVLDRYYQAATLHNADVVVRVTSDCPLIDPHVIDLVIERFCASRNVDYVSCTLAPRTFPRGLDTEAFSYDALAEAQQQATEPLCREHVTPYFYNNPDLFDLDGVYSSVNNSQLRWTVDTPEDLQLAEMIFQHFGHDHFGWQEAVAACNEHPQWLRINAHVEQKHVEQKHAEQKAA